MTNAHDADKKLDDLLRAFLRGKIDRRQLLFLGAAAGLSTTALGRMIRPTPARAAAMLDSDPVSPYELPITPERVEFLKSKPYKGQTINVLVCKITVGDCVKYHAPHWEEATGGKINIAEVPIETLHQQIFSDLASGLGKYDAYMPGAWFYGDFFQADKPYIVPIDQWIPDPKHAYWDPGEWLPSIKKLYSWDGKIYGGPADADGQALYYRRDLFANPDIQAKFKAKFNYDLPAPPTTMQQYHDVCDFFTGWDWNGDGQNDWGLSLHAKVNEQGFFHFLTLSAPFVISPDNKYYFFNPDTMKPLINSEGHLKALEDYVKFLANGPKEQIAWTLGQGWNLFLAGNSATEPTWGDLPTLAQDPKTSKVQGKMGAAPLPGTTEAFNPITGEWKKYDLNQVGNTNGGSWHLVISSFSKKQEMVYDFLSFMANKKNALWEVATGWTGVQPGFKFEYFPPDGSGNPGQWKDLGWNEDDAVNYLSGYYKALAAPVQQEYLRIPGAAEYWHELDINLSAVLGGQMEPKAALDATAEAWEKITDRYGRDAQKKLYQASFA